MTGHSVLFLWSDFRQLVVKFGGSYLSNWWKRAVCEIKSKWLLHSAFLAPEAGIPGPTWTAEVFPTDAFVSSSSPDVLTASKSRFDMTVFEPLSSSRVIVKKALSLVQIHSIYTLKKGHFESLSAKTVILSFLENKRLLQENSLHQINRIIYLKATYGTKKMKQNRFFNSCHSILKISWPSLLNCLAQ